jgi:hypothetical protein
MSAGGESLAAGRHEPRRLLEMATALSSRADPATAGLWPRASALLALQALEAGLARLWQRQGLDLRGCSIRTQLLCLRGCLDDAPLAALASHAWSALSRACHHHPYELAPTAAELLALLGDVGELVTRAED